MENITNETFLVFAFEKLLTFQTKSNFFQSFKRKNFLIEKSLTIQDSKTYSYFHSYFCLSQCLPFVKPLKILQQ